VSSELFDLAVLWARNRRIRQAIVYCLNENQAMAHRLQSRGADARGGERHRGAARTAAEDAHAVNKQLRRQFIGQVREAGCSCSGVASVSLAIDAGDGVARVILN
jgi:hypothetical protein